MATLSGMHILTLCMAYYIKSYHQTLLKPILKKLKLQIQVPSNRAAELLYKSNEQNLHIQHNAAPNQCVGAVYPLEKHISRYHSLRGYGRTFLSVMDHGIPDCVEHRDGFDYYRELLVI